MRNRKDELHRLRAISGGGSQTFDEDFDYDALNRLKEVRQGGGVSMALTYANNGNIRTKSDVQGGATCTYGTRPSQCNRTPGPRAVSQIGTQSYCYDAMGNQTHQYNNSTLVRQIDYNAIGKASRIVSHGTEVTSGRSAGETRFTYDGSRNQVRRHSTEQGKTSTIIQQGGTELIIEGSERRFRRNLGNAIVERSGDTITTRYVYTDHLGSVDVITNAAGQLLEKLSFDAFGKRRAVFSSSGQSIALNLSTLLAITHQGFTGHQQVDHAGIVQMGGRIYDAHIGRFLQADPFVQSPSNSQNFNRYSYVLNNPLSYTDPSGYIFKSIKKHWRTIVAVGLTIVAPWGTGLWATIATGALSGYIATGSLKGALVGAFSAGMFYGIGSAMPGGSFGSGAHLGKTVAHGVAGGISSVLSGGKFGHGFASAGFAQLGAPAIDKIGGRSGNYYSATNRAHRIISAAVVGGTASTLAGGKFANGAITAAFSRGFNDEAKHKWQRSLQAVQEEQAAIGVATKALDKVLGSSRLDLGIEIDSNGNITTSASANLDRLKISINSDMEATVLAGPSALVGQSFSVHDGAAQKAVASYGLIELSVASFDNGVINYDVQLGAGAYIRYSGGFDLRNWGSAGQYIRAVHARESYINNHVCKNLRGVQGC